MRPEPQKWIVGKQYPVVPGELFYMSIRNEEKLRELQDWQKANDALDMVQKGLDDYLETKRGAFARFYFLSNDELLEILSQTKDPLRVQPHLGKCFDGIGKLVFGENNIIEGMYSGEGEKVLFGGENITPTSMVEQWLTLVETYMFKSVDRVANESLVAYDKTDRPKWTTEWPGQIIITVTQIDWTRCIDSALIAGGKALQEYAEKSATDLEAIVQLVRGDLPKLVRKSVSPLIVSATALYERASKTPTRPSSRFMKPLATVMSCASSEVQAGAPGARHPRSTAT